MLIVGVGGAGEQFTSVMRGGEPVAADDGEGERFEKQCPTDFQRHVVAMRRVSWGGERRNTKVAPKRIPFRGCTVAFVFIKCVRGYRH